MSAPQNLIINKKSLQPPIFIGGEGRSGTRLLRNVVGRHKNILEIPRETYIYGTKSIKSSKLFSQLEKQRDFDNLTLAILTAMHFKKDITYQKILTKEFTPAITDLHQKIKQLQEYTQIQNKYDTFNLCANYLTCVNHKSRWVEKTPSNLHNIKQILQAYPNAKIIIIYRDPRAVCCSWKKKDKHKSTLGSIISWNTSLSIMHKESQAHKSNIITIRYEDLITFPTQVIKPICNFIGEDFDPNMLKDITVVNTHFADSKQSKGFDPTPLHRWKMQLSDAEKMFIDITTKASRNMAGYKDAPIDFSIGLYLSFILFITLEPFKLFLAKAKKLLIG